MAWINLRSGLVVVGLASRNEMESALHLSLRWRWWHLF